ncbi:MAG: hypothetical protein Q8P67_24270, partial [archaeon]|nr:hypothetical protein [archaeon]
MSSSRRSTPSSSAEPASDGCPLKVAVRVRPMTEDEKRNGSAKATIRVDANDNTIEVVGSKYASLQTKKKFDQVYGQAASQEYIFRQTVAPIVDEALKGFHCTLFAYGQTGTGKTWTMEGGKVADSSHDWHGPTSGMIGRSVQMIFDHLEKNAHRMDYAVKISYMELHNEVLNDLLTEREAPTRGAARPGSSTESATELKIKTTSNGIVVDGLQEIGVKSAEEIFDRLENAMNRRQVASTNSNHQSSRSHAIFTIVIQTRESSISSDNVIRTGKLHLVDLAGSENAGRSGATGGRQQEASNINKSLLTLGRVINALTTGELHVPYRESKLTRLLQESLGGRAKTAIIATISPSPGNLDETLSTLDYANRAQSIQ